MPYAKLESAIDFALKAHQGHYRKGEHALPYILHPLDVLHKVRHLGQVIDEDVLCAAVLHDVLEDTNLTPDEMERLFGSRVRDLVEQLTRRLAPKNDPAYSEMLLQDIASMEPDAQVIKLADRLSNLWECKRTRPMARTQKYAEEAVLILRLIPRERAPELWDALDLLTQSVLD